MFLLSRICYNGKQCVFYGPAGTMMARYRAVASYIPTHLMMFFVRHPNHSPLGGLVLWMCGDAPASVFSSAADVAFAVLCMCI